MIATNAVKLNRKANLCKVIGWSSFGVYSIKSPSGKTYRVDLSRGGICSCEWGQKGGSMCSHEMAARKHWAKLHEGRAVSFQNGHAPDVAKRQHKIAEQVAVSKTGAMSMVYRDASPLRDVCRFSESWDGEGVDLYRTGADGKDTHEFVSADYNALVDLAKSLGWTQVGLYWWREGEV